MIETRSVGTGVDSLKLFANFRSSVNFTSLSALALLLRTFSAFMRCWLAKFLKSLSTSRSTVEVALGAASFDDEATGLDVAAELCVASTGFSLDLDSFAFESAGSEGLASVALSSVGLASAGF